jgi:beta-lactamase class A
MAMAVAFAAILAGTPRAQSSSGLQRLLAAEVSRFPGEAGVWVRHLQTGEEAGVRADERFNSASVIKIPVMALAYELAANGKLSLDERLTIRPGDVRGGSGVFRYHDAGLQPTLRDVVMQMIITSDNTATDQMITRVGGVAAVNDWLAAHGYGDTLSLTQTTGELFAKYSALPPGSADRNQKTTSERSYWLGEMTPRATGQLLAAMQACADPSSAAKWTDSAGPRTPFRSKTDCEAMVRIMRAQQAGARRLPHFVQVPVAHKTGDFPPVLANDVGIAFARSGPIVISVFTNAITGSYGEAEDRIGRLAQLVVGYFDGTQ